MSLETAIRNVHPTNIFRLRQPVMLHLLQCLVLMLVSARTNCASGAAVTVGPCPTWRWFNYSSGECQCGSDVGGTIKCSEGNSPVYARFDMCLSWDNNSQTMLTSVCKFKRSRTSVTGRVFSVLPQSPYNLSYDECELNNREGMFCGRCRDGFAPSLYIFRGKCVNCSHCLQNPASFFLFLASEVFPLTVFYLILMKLRLNIVSGPMLGYVMFCQVHINSVYAYSNIWNFILSHSADSLHFWNTNVLFPLAGIWNLNFFAMFIPNLCYSCGLNDLSIILTEYLSVLYIFILVAISFIFLSLDLKRKLYSSAFCQAMIFSTFNNWCGDWSFSDSTMHALATFTALFVAKVGAISARLLSATSVYNINGSRVELVVSHEPFLEPYSIQHTPYAVAAFVPIICFVVTPAVLLFLYPSRHFQNLLSRCCGPRKRLALAIFVDTISSGYRDGLDGGRDWRRLFPVFLIVLMGIITILSKFLTGSPENYLFIYFLLTLFLSILVMYFSPCKAKEMNLSLSFHLIITALCALTLALWIQDYYLNARFLEIFLSVCLSLPHVVMLLWLLRHIVTRCQSLRNCCLETKQVCFGRAQFLLHRFE